jgi:hypothetical protein
MNPLQFGERRTHHRGLDPFPGALADRRRETFEQVVDIADEGLEAIPVYSHLPRRPLLDVFYHVPDAVSAAIVAGANGILYDCRHCGRQMCAAP